MPSPRTPAAQPGLVLVSAARHVAATAAGSAPAEPCVCGHPKEAHEHYRDGFDCGTCGKAVCPSYRPAGTRGRVREVWEAVATAVWAVRMAVSIWRHL